MLDKYTRETAAKAIKGHMNSFISTKDSIVEKNRREYLASLGPGAQIPSYIKLSPENSERMNNALNTLKQGVTEIITSCIDTVAKSITAAPSTEALNTIQMLALRKNVTVDDIYSLIDKYGDNVQVHKTIRDIAEQHNIYINKSNEEEQYENLVNLQGVFDRMSLYKVDSYTRGYMSMVNIDVDNALGIEAAEE